jgi:type II secretory pathway component PulF
MEAATKESTILSPTELLEGFFTTQTAESAQLYVWHLFQAWASLPAEKKQYSDEEIALFLDQLNDLVAAAYQLHEANKANAHVQEGESNA